MTKHNAQRVCAYLSLSTLPVVISLAAAPKPAESSSAQQIQAVEITAPKTASDPKVKPQKEAKKSSLEVTLTASHGYDSNVYLVDTGVLGNRESSVSTLGARIVGKFESGASLSYGATASRFWDETTQDNIRHVLGAGWRKKVGAYSWNAETEFTQVDGSSTTADYDGAQKSAFTTTAPRERGDQLQNKTDLVARYDGKHGFVRGVGKLQYWDMQTKLDAGEKYVDRYDLNGGVDIGRIIGKPGVDYYLGYRHGYQFQDDDGNVPDTVLTASNHYDRYLVGVDGKIIPALKLDAQIGWEIHDYGRRDDSTQEGIFADLTATWAVNKADELQLRASRNYGLNSTHSPTNNELNSTLNTAYEISWKHVISPAWSTNLTARVAETEYTPKPQDDLNYTLSAALTWQATKAVSVILRYRQDWIRENGANITALQADQREADRSFVSATVSWKL